VNVEDVEQSLPDGFHDAKLCRIDVDFARATCTLEFRVDYEEGEKVVSLTLTGLALCSVEPPFPEARYVPLDAQGTRVDGFPTSEEVFPSLKAYADLLPAGCFFYSFYLTSTNSFIHVAASSAALAIREGGGDNEPT